MPRPSKGPRLYLRAGRIDSKTGKQLPDIWFIRDGPVERSTGAGPDGIGAAEQALAAYIIAKHAEPAPEPGRTKRPRDPDSVPVTDVITLYLNERSDDLQTDRATTRGFFKHLVAWWGDKNCSDVIRSNCKAYVAYRVAQPNAAYKDPETAPRISDQTARRELEDLSSAIGFWHGEYPFTTPPTVWLPDKSEGSRDALTRSEAAALLWAAMGWQKRVDGCWVRNRTAKTNRMHLRRFILIGLYTGPRQKVIQKLLWEESATNAWADLDTAVIYRRGKHEKEHKTKRRTVVKIPARLLAHMKRWRRLDQEREARVRLKEPDYRLNSVMHFGGQPIDGKMRTAFETAVRNAGLPTDVGPHWLRHTAATWLMKNGVELYKAAGFLGMTVKVLEDHYQHHQPDFQGDAARGAQRRVSG